MRRYPLAERIAPEHGKVGLWRAEGEFWGMDSPLACRQPLTRWVIPRGSSPGAGPGRPWSAAWSLTPPQPIRSSKQGPAARKSRLWRRFRLPCPLGSITALSAWLFWKANCNDAAGAVVQIEAQRLNDPKSNKKRAGEAGSSWGMPGGRIAKAIRGGRRPRAGGGEAPKRRRFSSFSVLSLHRGRSYPQAGLPQNSPFAF